jgi:hypothetical protein
VLANDRIHLLGSHRLTVLAQMKTLTVYHVSDLLCSHSPVGRGKAIDYGFLYLHCPNLRIFQEMILEKDFI